MLIRFSVLVGLTASAILAGGCEDEEREIEEVPGVDAGLPPQLCEEDEFFVTTLVTNQTDPQLINPWGVAPGNGVFWIADNGTGVVSVFDPDGRPGPDNGRFSLGQGITGVANLVETGESGSPFLINTTPPGCKTPTFAPAEFLFASMTGKLIAINSSAPPQGIVAVDLSSTGAMFFGVTRVDMAGGPVVLAADFANGRVDMFDTSFKQIETPTGAIAPFNDPNVPAGFSPFNVLRLGDRVFVAYALRGPTGDEEHGPGLGQVTIFDTSGAIIGRLQSNLLNAPWGMVLVPAGEQSELCQSPNDTLFVGNFGDGHITRFDLARMQATDQLTDANHNTIVIDGLWGMVTGTATVGNPNTIYFAAGPNDETGGEFGRIEPNDNHD